jgi:hypothetical protein
LTVWQISTGERDDNGVVTAKDYVDRNDLQYCG